MGCAWGTGITVRIRRNFVSIRAGAVLTSDEDVVAMLFLFSRACFAGVESLGSVRVIVKGSA